MISGKCEKGVFFADPCGILMELQEQGKTSEIAERQGSGFLAAKRVFNAPVGIYEKKFKMDAIMPLIEAKQKAAATMLRSHGSGSGKLDLLIEANRPQAWLHFMSKLLLLKRLVLNIRPITMDGGQGIKMPREKERVEDWASEPNMPEIGKRAITYFQSEILKVAKVVTKKPRSDKTFTPVLNYFVGRDKGGVVSLFEKPSLNSAKLATLESRRDPRTMDILLNYMLAVMVSDHTADKKGGNSFVGSWNTGSELLKGFYEFFAREVATLAASRVKHFNKVLKFGRERMSFTKPVDVRQAKPVSFKSVLKSDGGKLNQIVSTLLRDKGVVKDPNEVTLKISKEENQLDREKLNLKREKEKVKSLEKLPVDVKVYGRQWNGFDLKVPNKN
jgi:hypothetical protein